MGQLASVTGPQNTDLRNHCDGIAIAAYIVFNYSVTKKNFMDKQVAPVLQKKQVKESVTINAPVSKVWQALIDPAIIKQYFFGTEAKSDWKPGSPITFTGEWKGQSYKDKGTILKVEPNKLLQHTYWSSMAGLEDIPENYITVTNRLEGDDKQTKLTISQDMCTDEEEAKEMWKTVLAGLKKTVEGK